MKTADPPEADEFAENLFLIYPPQADLSGLCVLCGEF
jgi:hypothetical protein